ncbi:hypothetical protein ACFP81_02970 [Deinococcus lacus]|uniref:Uncharacterized protein n=1 Tax=Deinococcus lacus TaxID=392561 RepID=A0ABW1YCY2_9DEIO
MTLNENPNSSRFRWSGILAGLVMGAVTSLTVMGVGAVITSLTGQSLTGTGIQALIWAALAAIAGAYAAGLTATRASAPATYDNNAAMTKSDAGLIGLITGSLLVLLTTWMAASGISGLLGAAGNAAGALSRTAGVAGMAAGAAGSAAAQNGQVRSFVDGISQDDIEYLVAENTELSQEQVEATANVVANVFNRAKFDLGDVDITNVTDVAKSRVEFIRQQLSGPQFVNRLERQGLTQAQATDVQKQITGEVDRLEAQSAALAEQAEATARKAGSTAGLSWLLSAGLILLASRIGAINGAGGVRPVRVVDSTRPSGRA